MKNKYKFDINTWLDEENGIIHTEFNNNQFDYLIGNVYKTVIKTQDEHIKEALIKLGWTPPPKEK